MSSSKSKASVRSELRTTDDVKNENANPLPKSGARLAGSQTKSVGGKPAPSAHMGFDLDMQFVNAEALDRAIVNRLQSRMTTSVADVIPEMRPSETLVKLRCQEDFQGKQEFTTNLVEGETTVDNATPNSEMQDFPEQETLIATSDDDYDQYDLPSQATPKFQSTEPAAQVTFQCYPTEVSNPPPLEYQFESNEMTNPPQGAYQYEPIEVTNPPQLAYQYKSNEMTNPPQLAYQYKSNEMTNLPQGAYQYESTERTIPQQVAYQYESAKVTNLPQVPHQYESAEKDKPPPPAKQASYQYEHGVTETQDASKARQRSLSQMKESLSQSSVMSHDIPATNLLMEFKNLPGDSPSPAPHPTFGEEIASADERRSLMRYRNSQFNLENSSKEALCSSSIKLLPDSNFQSDTILHLPMFGIPDPSMHRRPSLSNSSESITALEKKSARDALAARLAMRTRARSSSPTPGRSLFSARISGTHIGDHVFESAVNDIIERGGDEFRSKYSSWLWDAFRAQLDKLKSLMLTEFNDKLKEVLEERELEVLELQKRYREKLTEFDSTTESYQTLMDNVYKENQRVMTAKDFVIDKLKKEFLECKRHFEQDLARQIESYRKEAEVDRLELQKRNDELMLIMLTDASKCGLEEAFKNEIESLHKMIKTLTSQNENLHQQLDDALSNPSLLGRTKATEQLEAQLDEATVEIMELRKKLQYAESEKEDLTVSLHQEIAKLNRKIQETNTRYDHQLRDAAEELELLRKKHSRESKDLKQKLFSQENQHSTVVNQIKQQYGSQVESLSQAVSQLRAELSGAGHSRY